ncbi:MAG: ABC transporter permease [Coriobacteriia bacterium]|nr:ABC transporter permease [Coriobacteriia bacterium]
MPIDDNTFIEPAEDDNTAVRHHLETGGMPLGQVAEQSNERSRTLWGDAWHRLLRNKLAVVALVYLVIVTLMAVTAPLWVKPLFGDPMYANSTLVMKNQFLPPSLAHPMGTDNFGLDVFGRVVYGARVSLLVGFVATGISVVLGIILGAISGYYGGLTDSIVMRITDVFLAFPYILLAILLISIMGMGLGPVLVAIGVLGWTTIARVFRSSILSVKRNDYIEAAKAMGASDMRIMMRHILPNALAPIIVYATMSVGGVILTEAALSFLGIGVQAPTPSWGLMLNDAQSYIVTHPGLFIWPGLAIILTVLAFVLLGDGLRDALDVKVSE